MILGNCDLYFKQAISLLKELKEADIKLRDSFHYNNEFIGNLQMSLMANKMLINKIKKLEVNSN